MMPLRDLRSVPEGERFHELVGGELVRRARPSGPRGRARFRLATAIGGPYDRPAGRGGPGGWIFAMGVEIRLDGANVLRPDVAGWRRERLRRLTAESPVEVRPDWACEILSGASGESAGFERLRAYQRCGVGHCWIVDPVSETLAGYRWTREGYLLVLTAAGAERVRAEPFADVEISARGVIAEDEDGDGEEEEGGESGAPGGR